MIFRFSVFFKHDLFRKPVSTFRDHAIGARTIASSRQKSPGAPVECQPKIFRACFRLFAFRPFAARFCGGCIFDKPSQRVPRRMLRRESSMTKLCHVDAAYAVFGKRGGTARSAAQLTLSLTMDD
jgi:hypothetical protein